METLRLEWRGEDDAVAVVTLNRPAVMNAINTKMIEELLGLVREQAYNADLRCMVVTGAGERAFSTGGDLKERNGMSNEQWRRQHHLIEDLFMAWRDFPVPTIAAVEGFAFAGGCELALMCDLVVASESARFAVKEVTRGIIPGSGGIQELARCVGMRLAKEMIYTGRELDAPRAREAGMANHVVPTGHALARAVEIAEEIRASAPMSVRMAKVAINRGVDAGFHTGYALDIAAYNVLVASEDRLEGIAAFNEKRAPRWKNR